MKKENEENRCSKCNSIKLFDDIDKRTREGFVMCLDCGFNYTLKWKQDENGDCILKDNTKGFLVENLILEKTEIKNSFGFYKIKNSNGNYGFGTLMDSTDYDFLRQYIHDFRPDDINEVTINRYVNGELIKEKLLGNNNIGMTRNDASY